MNPKLKDNLETTGVVNAHNKLQFVLPVKTEFKRSLNTTRSIIKEGNIFGSFETTRDYDIYFWKDSGSRYDLGGKGHYIILPIFKKY